MGRYHKDKAVDTKRSFVISGSANSNTKKSNSLGNHWLDYTITSLGTQLCPSVPLHAEHAGVMQLISFPLNAPGCILLLSLHLQHLQMHERLRKLSALRQVNPFHPDIRKQ